MRRWARQTHHRGRSFYRDGIIDPERWWRARKRVLFLLKEAYGAPRDLCEEIRSWGGPRYNIWRNAACCALAVHFSSRRHLPPFPGDAVTQRAANEALLSSAIVNVKKSGGHSSSDSEDLLKYAQLDRVYLLEQISLVRPHVVISGNVWGCVQHLWPAIEPVYDLAWSADGMLFLNLWHPARGYHQLNYYAIASLVRGAAHANKALFPGNSGHEKNPDGPVEQAALPAALTSRGRMQRGFT
jgi:hypothetical protein